MKKYYVLFVCFLALACGFNNPFLSMCALMVGFFIVSLLALAKFEEEEKKEK